MTFLLRFNLLLFLLLQSGITTVESRRSRASRDFVLSREDIEHYTSDTSIQDYDVTTPVYIEPASMVSKRSADSGPVSSTEREVKFNAFGQTYHVRLQPNYWLMRQGLVVERVGADGTITEEDIPSRDCYYYTHLISHSGESAGALSTCDGLRGMISHDEADIYIAPLKDHHALRYRRQTQDEFDGERAHIVYKRSSSRGQHTSETMSSASSSFDYDHDDDDDNNDADSDDGDIYYSYDETSGFDGNNTYNNRTFCDEVYAPGYTEGRDPSLRDSLSWNPGSLDGGNVSHSEPIFADIMAAGQEEGEHLQEGGHRYIEMFLLLDDKMNKFHKEDLLNFSLAVMNIVSRRYSEPSLRAEVRIALVKIVVAETEHLTMTGLDGINYTLTIQPEGGKLVNDLCAWQDHFNPEGDDDPLHYDGTTLLTRRDLYIGSPKNNGLLGRAPVGTICKRDSSCNINEEDGLETALTITHELAHNLNLQHDPDYGCKNGRHIMTSMSCTGPSSFKWSSCSASFFAEFLESPRSNCLLDEPFTDHPDVQMLRIDALAGAQYTRLEQCQKAFGNGITKLCSIGRPDVTCGQISCKRWGYCMQTPVIEGTKCGENMWCYDGFCTSSLGGIPQPVNGGWGEWQGSYSECSRSCGAGLIYKKRPCNNPAPRFGGNACEGPMYIMETCNTNPCPGVNTSEDFRHHECALTNSIKLRYRLHKWSADLDGVLIGDRLCELRCVSHRGGVASRPPSKVSAGTRCWNDKEPDELRRIRRCVNKVCKEFGCDGVYGSGKFLDECGKCEGSGRTCTLVKGTLQERIPDQMKYVPWLTIPIGSTMINITNTNGMDQNMALSIDGVFVYRPSTVIMARPDAQRYTIGPIHILLRGVRFRWEQIWVLSGPTTKEIKIEIKQDSFPFPAVSLRKFRNQPDFFYEWYQPITDPVSYYWEVYPVTECSETCGGGNQTLNATCIEEINGVKLNMSDRLCEETTVKPVYGECNTDTCPYGPGPMWLEGEWGECSVTCGVGIKERPVDCINGSTMVPLADTHCHMGAATVSPTASCSKPACPTLGPTSSAPSDTDESTSTSTMHSTVTMTILNDEAEATTDGDVTVEVTTYSDITTTSPRPFLTSIPRNGCRKEYNTPNMLVSLTIGGLVVWFKLYM